MAQASLGASFIGKSLATFFPVNGEGRTRTGDTPVFSRVLYQLSYLAAIPR